MKKNIITPVFYTQFPNGHIKIMDGMTYITAIIQEAKKKRPLINNHKPSNY